MKTLYLPLKAEYFELIKRGMKRLEFRKMTPYWRKRLEDRDYDRIVLTKGYPPKGQHSRRLVRPWNGCIKTSTISPIFGRQAVRCYAIRVNP